MSAIFGVIGAVSPAELRAMGQRMSHRGRVATCDEVAPGVHLGRVAAESRPVCTSNGLAAVVDVSSVSDGEAVDSGVVHALINGGLSGLDSLGIPFALAAWDDRSKTLVLARDFVGQKPLHYCALPGGGTAFATEYKALLALDSLPAEPDLDALQYLQCHKTTPPGKTLLRRVQVAAPGAVTRIGPGGKLLSQDHMRPLRVDVRGETETAARDELARRYIAAIDTLVADRPRVGISLSGGIDSMSIAFVTRRCAPRAELVGFTAGHGPDDPEIRTAATVMDRLGGRHEPVPVTAGSLHELLPQAVWHFGSPVGRTETVQMLEIGRAARQEGFDWILSGMGSDALFAGMPKHKLLWLSQLLPPLRKDLLEFYALTQSGRRPRRPLARLMDLVYFRGSVPAVPGVRGATYAPDLPAFPRPGPEFLNDALAANAHENLSRSLVRLERPLQAFGIDFASPFFNRDVMDYAFSIPSRLKIRRGRDKYILRQALQSLIGPDLVRTPKGISRILPDKTFADTLQQLANHYLSSDRVRKRGWFDMDEVRNIQRSIGRATYHNEAAMRLWTLIVTEIWAGIYLDQRARRPGGDKVLQEAVSRPARAGAPGPRPC